MLILAHGLLQNGRIWRDSSATTCLGINVKLYPEDTYGEESFVKDVLIVLCW